MMGMRIDTNQQVQIALSNLINKEHRGKKSYQQSNLLVQKTTFPLLFRGKLF